MYILKNPVFHVVDEAMQYNAAQFLTKVTSENIVKALIRCWNKTYLGTCDCLRMDQGSQFVFKVFLYNVEAEDISFLPAPIESPTTMSHME